MGLMVYDLDDNCLLWNIKGYFYNYGASLIINNISVSMQTRTA